MFKKIEKKFNTEIDKIIAKKKLSIFELLFLNYLYFKLQNTNTLNDVFLEYKNMIQNATKKGA